MSVVEFPESTSARTEVRTDQVDAVLFTTTVIAVLALVHIQTRLLITAHIIPVSTGTVKISVSIVTVLLTAPVIDQAFVLVCEFTVH